MIANKFYFKCGGKLINPWMRISEAGIKDKDFVDIVAKLMGGGKKKKKKMRKRR